MSGRWLLCCRERSVEVRDWQCVQNANQSLIKPIAFKPVVLPVQPHYGTASRHPVSPRQPLIAQRAPPTQQHQPPRSESQETPPSPQGHSKLSNHNNNYPPEPHHLETMRAKTLSPYELHSNSLNGSATINGSYNSPQQIAQSTPKTVLFDRKVGSQGSSSGHHDDGYISQDCHSGSHSHSNSSHSNTSHGSLHNDSDRSFEHTSQTNGVPRGSSGEDKSGGPLISPGRVTMATLHRGEGGYGQTPSPSDSGVGELEAMLRSKDTVIQQLRETMEKNETAMLQVCAEKEQNWDLELQQAHTDWERRWRQHQQKTFKMEQALLLQLFKLQQERKALRLDIEKSKSERDLSQAKLSECLDDLKQTKVKLDEVNWELCQKSGEISLLKSQLKDSKDEAVHKKNEVISTKTQLKNYQKTSDQKDHEILTLEAELKRVESDLKTTNGTIASLQKDLETAKKEVFNAQQKADLKELQLDMKTKELEKAHIEHSKRINALKSSPVATKASSVVSPGQKSEPLASPVGNGLRGSPSVTGTDKDSVKSGASSDSKTQVAQPEECVTLKAELEQVRAELEKTKAGFAKERDQWLEEKNKVIRYQKHLQLNYVQMYRKNKMLESEVEQLTLDLEKKDLSLMDSQEGGDKILEGEESMC